MLTCGGGFRFFEGSFFLVLSSLLFAFLCFFFFFGDDSNVLWPRTIVSSS